MSAKHTPGPWELHYVNNGEFSGLVLSDGSNVADCGIAHLHNIMAASAQSSRDVSKEIAERTANARLISAAPELLEALELTLAYVVNNCQALGTERMDVFRVAGDAISRAKGE